MADDANEDSWLYGTSNPDSTTNEEERATSTDPLNSTSTAENEDETVSSNQHNQSPDSNAKVCFGAATPPEDDDDPAQEMEEDEQAVVETSEADMKTEDDNYVDGPGKGSVTRTSDESDDDESDDDINVVIGDIKSGPGTFNIKQRTNLLGTVSSTIPGGPDKMKPAQGGKFNIEEFESVGTINGVPAHEFSIDSLDEKPWRKPGADITDYFNYGFNEDTWRAYCERQKRFRIAESGVGLQSLSQISAINSGAREHREHGERIDYRGRTSIGDNGIEIGRANGPPTHVGHMGGPGIMTNIPPNMNMNSHRTLTAVNNDHGAGKYHNAPSRGMRNNDGRNSAVGGPPSAKENVIQVMTAECREYSRTGLPMTSNYVPEDTFFEPDPYEYGGYEPTQESQWMEQNPSWVPSGIKELTPGPGINAGMSMPPPQMGGPIIMGPMPPPMGMGPPPMAMIGASGPMRMPMPPRMMGPPPQAIVGANDRVERHERERRRYSRSRSRSPKERSRHDDRNRNRDERKRSRDREREQRERERSERGGDRRERERSERSDRDWDRSERAERVERTERERTVTATAEEPERTDDERERRRHKERSSRRDRSRSREKSRRRSKSREKEREKERESRSERSSKTSSRSEKKKSHRKDKEESE